MKKLLSLASAALLFSSCSTVQQAERDGQFTVKSTYTLEMLFPSPVSGKTYRLEPGEITQAKNAYEASVIRKYLYLGGLTEASSPKSKPDYLVDVSLKTEAPSLGIAIGNLSGYTQRVRLTAYPAQGARTIAWQVVASGPSEEADIGKSIHRVLGATRGHWGRSSDGEVTISLPPNDESMNELQ